jgi:hypothetical protein
VNSPRHRVRIRRMSEADVDRVMEIGERLAEAPNWLASAYAEAVDPKHIPRRIALVAEDPESDALAGFLVASLGERFAAFLSCRLHTSGGICKCSVNYGGA